MSHLREGAWISARTGQWSFISEHADWAITPGNLARLGFPGGKQMSLRKQKDTFLARSHDGFPAPGSHQRSSWRPENQSADSFMVPGNGTIVERITLR